MEQCEMLAQSLTEKFKGGYLYSFQFSTLLLFTKTGQEQFILTP